MMVGRMIELMFTDIKREESKMDEEIELQTNCSESTLRIKTDNLSESEKNKLLELLEAMEETENLEGDELTKYIKEHKLHADGDARWYETSFGEKKHNREFENFWSKVHGGVIYGCRVCDKEEELKKRLEEAGFIIEEQPKLKITREDDDGFLMMYDNLEDFEEAIKVDGRYGIK